MEKPLNSQLITYPSTIEPTGNHTVLLIDASSRDIERIAEFCRTSNENFDIYLYEGNTGDYEYMSYVSNRCDVILIEDSSQVRITPSQTRYGPTCELKDPLNYFKKIEQIALDTI